MPRKKLTKPQSVTIPSGAVIPLGGLAHYYFNGWRVGYLEEIIETGKIIKVRPLKVGARLITLTPEDLKEIS